MKRHFIIFILFISTFFLFSCCSTKETGTQNEVTKMLKKTRPVQLPPGTAEISATVLSVNYENGRGVCVMRIDTIHGYGPATKPLAEGGQIEAEIDRVLQEKATESISKMFKKGVHKTLRVRYSGSKMDKSGKWQIISIR